jgi:hypothetical protein
VDEQFGQGVAPKTGRDPGINMQQFSANAMLHLRTMLLRDAAPAGNSNKVPTNINNCPTALKGAERVHGTSAVCPNNAAAALHCALHCAFMLVRRSLM